MESTDYWYVHFYDAVITNEWDPVVFPANSAIFTFIEQDTTSAFTVTTRTDYATSNSNVVLDVFFTEYELAYFSLGTTPPADRETLTIIDPTAVIYTTQSWTHTVRRRVIPSVLVGATVPPDPSDSNWITPLDMTFDIVLYDCSLDFILPSDNFAMLSGQESYVDAASNAHKFEIGSGEYRIDVTLPA